ncbi:hypothetical protein B0H13DRAFT_1975493 [Mycena leptocephala]|nr:hypothetical protein B0H13DRAFT_1975493 [Mycena leptocephala]
MPYNSTTFKPSHHPPCSPLSDCALDAGSCEEYCIKCMHCAYPTQARAMKSPVNEKTIDTLPEPVEPPPRFARIPCAPTPPANVPFVLWSVNISLSLVEYFRLIAETHVSQLQVRILLVWAACSGVFVVLTTAVFVSTLLRRPSRSFVSFLRGLAIFMSFTSCIVGFAVMFPVIAECTNSGCSSGERTLRFFVCGGVPVASVWTWVWIPTIGKLLRELE